MSLDSLALAAFGSRSVPEKEESMPQEEFRKITPSTLSHLEFHVHGAESPDFQVARVLFPATETRQRRCTATPPPNASLDISTSNPSSNIMRETTTTTMARTTTLTTKTITKENQGGMSSVRRRSRLAHGGESLMHLPFAGPADVRALERRKTSKSDHAETIVVSVRQQSKTSSSKSGQRQQQQRPLSVLVPMDTQHENTRGHENATILMEKDVAHQHQKQEQKRQNNKENVADKKWHKTSKCVNGTCVTMPKQQLLRQSESNRQQSRVGSRPNPIRGSRDAPLSSLLSLPNNEPDGNKTTTTATATKTTTKTTTTTTEITHCHADGAEPIASSQSRGNKHNRNSSNTRRRGPAEMLLLASAIGQSRRGRGRHGKRLASSLAKAKIASLGCTIHKASASKKTAKHRMTQRSKPQRRPRKVETTLSPGTSSALVLASSSRRASTKRAAALVTPTEPQTVTKPMARSRSIRQTTMTSSLLESLDPSNSTTTLSFRGSYRESRERRKSQCRAPPKRDDDSRSATRLDGSDFASQGPNVVGTRSDARVSPHPFSHWDTAHDNGTMKPQNAVKVSTEDRVEVVHQETFSKSSETVALPQKRDDSRKKGQRDASEAHAHKCKETSTVQRIEPCQPGQSQHGRDSGIDAHPEFNESLLPPLNDDDISEAWNDEFFEAEKASAHHSVKRSSRTEISTRCTPGVNVPSGTDASAIALDDGIAHAVLSLRHDSDNVTRESPPTDTQNSKLQDEFCSDERGVIGASNPPDTDVVILPCGKEATSVPCEERCEERGKDTPTRKEAAAALCQEVHGGGKASSGCSNTQACAVDSVDVQVGSQDPISSHNLDAGLSVDDTLVDTHVVKKNSETEESACPNVFRCSLSPARPPNKKRPDHRLTPDLKSSENPIGSNMKSKSLVSGPCHESQRINGSNGQGSRVLELETADGMISVMYEKQTPAEIYLHGVTPFDAGEITFNPPCDISNEESLGHRRRDEKRSEKGEAQDVLSQIGCCSNSASQNNSKIRGKRKKPILMKRLPKPRLSRKRNSSRKTSRRRQRSLSETASTNPEATHERILKTDNQNHEADGKKATLEERKGSRISRTDKSQQCAVVQASHRATTSLSRPSHESPAPNHEPSDHDHSKTASTVQETQESTLLAEEDEKKEGDFTSEREASEKFPKTDRTSIAPYEHEDDTNLENEKKSSAVEQVPRRRTRRQSSGSSYANDQEKQSNGTVPSDQNCEAEYDLSKTTGKKSVESGGRDRAKQGTTSKHSNGTIPSDQNCEAEYELSKKAGKKSIETGGRDRAKQATTSKSVRFEIPDTTGKTDERNDEWTAAELENLKKAHRATHPTENNFWAVVSASLNGRKSASECRDRWFAIIDTPVGKNRQIAKSIPTSTLGLGSETQRKDNKAGGFDDIFESTPFRGSLHDLSTKEKEVKNSGDFYSRLQSTIPSPAPFASSVPAVAPSSDDEAGDDPMSPIRVRKGYKTYVQNLRRAQRKAEKLGRTRKKSFLHKEARRKKAPQRTFSAALGRTDVRLRGKLLPSGLVEVSELTESDLEDAAEQMDDIELEEKEDWEGDDDDAM